MANLIDGSMLVTQGKVDEVKLLIALDTGATTSIMAEKTALKYEFEIIESDVRIKTVNGQLLNVTGRKKVVSVEIEESKVEMSFGIMNHPDFDILLRLDWFNLTGAGIFPKTREINFPEKSLVNESNRNFENVFISEHTDENDIENIEDWDFSYSFKEIIPNTKLSNQENIEFKRLKPHILKCCAF